MRNPTRTLAIVAASICLQAALGAEGVALVKAPMTISEPGHYKVVRPIVVLGSDPVFRVIGDRVTLDLNGHTLSHTGSGAVILILPTIEDVTVKNGFLRGGGILADGSTGNRFEDLYIETGKETGIRSGGHVDIVNCDIIAGDGDGITVTGGNGSRIVNNRIRAQEHGIELRNARGSEILDNTIYDGDPGISVIKTAGASASDGGGNLIKDNLIGSSSVETGISVATSDNLIKHNLVSYCPSIGIGLSGDRNHVVGNVVGRNDFHGIIVDGSYNLLEGNQVSGNNPCGILFGNDNGHAYRNNMLRNNKEGAVCGAENTDAGGNIQ